MLADMPTETAVLTRRQVIRIAGAAGVILLAGPRVLAGAGGQAASARAASACVLSPNLEIGPYFVDVALNRSNVLANSDGSSVQPGVPLALTINLLDATTCAPISGAQIDMWQANASGVYSDESGLSTLGQTWLRGYQVTDSGGSVSFTTIFPGWYSGRTPHVHLMVRTFSGSTVAYEWTTQLLFEQTAIDTTLTGEAPYDTRAQPEPDTSNASDHVYTTMVADEATGHESMVLALSGSAASGYAATINVAVDLTDGGGTGATGGGPGGPPPGAPGSGSTGTSTGSTSTSTGSTATTTTAKDTTVSAKLSSCSVARIAGGHRRATVKVAATEAISVLAQIARGKHLLGQARLSKKASGVRTLHVPIKTTAAGGSATLHLTFTDAAGNTKSQTKTIHVPTRQS
jgi:protocatechuate 3,4-dioxygenase beta subunit